MRFYLITAAMFLCCITLVFAAPGTIIKTVSEPTFKAYTSIGRVVSFGGRNGTVAPQAGDYAPFYPTIATFSAYTGGRVVSSLLAQKATLGGNVQFNNISANSISIPQQLDEQSITLFEAAANGNNTVIIKPMANMSSSRIITIGNHGLYVNGVQALSW